ncbi:WXG domain conatining protein [Micromonospora sp. MW-13]|uniref:WXG100 family type VII secretion target n=1 Tax=Micromonospora sp. MW-13 TaxID=2094022 RepID=UPI000E44BE45|nr:WXG100 family type VII secretion target [Micromonospora sp. MW-13]RGC68276.1 WXG domain conatining protein [Micromonospora sp. MW-13]
MSEYTARYEHVSHQELYDAVKAGDPAQIDGLATKWNSMKGTLDDLARDLRSDLDKLANGWTGDAGREFQRRLSLIVDYSTTLSEGMADVRQGLTLMATDLRTAKKDAESPDETDDHDQAVSGALKGGATFGLPGAIVGGIMGHQKDKAEQEKAHRRMVQVVAELAAGYDLSAYGRLVAPPEPDRDLPVDPTTSTTTPSAGPGANTPTAAPGPGKGTPTTGHQTVSAPDSPAPAPHTGSTPLGGTGTVDGGLGTDPGAGTSLAGADPGLGGALPTGGTPGTVGLGGGTAAASAGTGAGLVFGAPTGAPAGGVLGGGTGSLAGSARGGATVPARPAGGLAAAEHRAATGVGRVGANGASGGRAGVLGGHGRTAEDESDERLTWLTEDDMVWRDGDTGVPPVLGAS